MEIASQKRTEISRLIDERRMSALQIWVAVLSALVVLLDGYDLQSVALAVPSLAVSWSLPPSRFSLVLAASMIGVAPSAAFLAPLGDRWGRRTMLIASTALVGAASVGTGFATTIPHLLVWRFLSGVGLGFGLPNAIALTSEYMPARCRGALVMLMYCNVALGAFVAGFAAPVIVEAFGWRGIFFAFGFLPLAMCLMLSLALPESIKFLVARKPQDRRIRTILARLAPGIDPHTVYAAEHDRVRRQSVLALLAPSFRARTLLLWCIFVLNSFVFYLLIYWLPSLLRAAGWPLAQALRGTVMIQAGGIGGGLLLSWCIDRGKTVAAMVSAYGITAIMLGLFLLVPFRSGACWLLLLVIGGGTSGAQFGLIVLSATIYPAVIRATGIGWGASVARGGAILSPLIGGWIMQQQIAPFKVLGMLAVPVALCGASFLLFPSVLCHTED